MLIFVNFFALGSGSAFPIQIRIQGSPINADPDPQHCGTLYFFLLERCKFRISDPTTAYRIICPGTGTALLDTLAHVLHSIPVTAWHPWAMHLLAWIPGPLAHFLPDPHLPALNGVRPLPLLTDPPAQAGTRMTNTGSDFRIVCDASKCHIRYGVCLLISVYLGTLVPGTGNDNWDGYHLVRYPSSCFPDPWLFDTDPNTRICTTYLRSRIIQILLRIQLQILLFSSVTFKIPTKNNLFFTAFWPIRVTF